MPSAEQEFEALSRLHEQSEAVERGQLFGKACLKVGGKAFLARQGELLAFKLNGPAHAKAIGLPEACLWDPSGKGRPMKEWVALPVAHRKLFGTLSKEALAYVSSAA